MPTTPRWPNCAAELPRRVLVCRPRSLNLRFEAMSATHQRIALAPFDAVAARYDETFTSSKIGQAQRASVWRELARHSSPEIARWKLDAGPAIDACFLAKRGVRVLACDSSSQMIAVATRRVQERGLQQLVQPLLLRAEDITVLHEHELFDGAFSNFGALNCVEDLAPHGA